MIWVKAFHIIAVITWFAALFYLPRLFVYHAMADDQTSIDRFKIMERKLYRGILGPSSVVAVGLGLWMLFDYAWEAYSHMLWLHIKLFLVVLLLIYQHMCGYYLKKFRDDKNTKSHVYFRWFNEFPVLILFVVVILAVVKPF